jgi:hypothetical protein
MRPLSVLLILVLFGCGSARKQLERATVYEREGMFQKAYDSYSTLYQKKPRNVEAHVGMKRCAQGILDQMQSEASGLYLANDLAAGDRKRQDALYYKQRMQREGFDLVWDPMVDTRRRELQTNEAVRLFELAEEAMRNDRFAEAEELVGRSLKLEPTNKEAEYLLKLAQLEPVYRQGKRAMELDLWRDAYRCFKRVTDRDAGYKDAWSLQAQARDKALVVLAYVPLFERGMYTNDLGLTLQGQVEGQLAAQVKQAILDLKDPVIMLVDRDNTEELLAEQQRQMTGVYDDRYVVEAGKLIGARYVLTVRILRYDEILRRDIEVQMQLLDAENGRIHLSEIVKVNKQEIGKGNTRSQLLDRAAKRMARLVADFDPYKR